MARTWFTKDNTADLDSSDLSILNRAARVVANETGNLSFTELCKLRMAYKAGRSAREVADIVIDN